jgi:cardiolipin synthase C
VYIRASGFGGPTTSVSRHCARARRSLLLCIVCALALVVCAAGTTGCSSLPTLEGRSQTYAIGAGDTTRLHDALAPLSTQHPGLTGIYALGEGRAAFAARMVLAGAAQRSLDVQYYIWHEDVSGTLMFEALRQAADRGVRVRLLLDDNNTKGMDPTLAALNAQPNVELRLFNPFVYRWARLWGYATDFSRLNRRMHNKSFTADGVATIIGGRNIGDEYFSAGEGAGFVDLDVIAIGAAVTDAERSFDEYWNSASAYPADRILPAATPAQMNTFASQGTEVANSARAQGYIAAVRETELVQKIIARQVNWEWCEAQLIVDDPAKALGKAKREDSLLSGIEQVVGPPKLELQLVSPYFVPTKSGVAAFGRMRARGVRVSILTNALEATDVAAVHAGYAKHRKELLRQGVQLWELKRAAADSPVGGGGGSGSSGSSGKSGGASLHAKTFSVDREQLFVGSFNFDPRSAALNTEMGLVIRSPVLAGRLANAFEVGIPAAAYEVQLTSQGELQWLERRAQGDVVYHTEPGTSGLRRFGVDVLSLLPIDWLL